MVPFPSVLRNGAGRFREQKPSGLRWLPKSVRKTRRANRMKVLVHDGIGVWLAARRLNVGKFVSSSETADTLSLSKTQFDALVLGLPWQRLGEAGIIRVI